jgi:hypothetical protein
MKLHLQYTVATLAYLTGIFLLSHLPGTESAPGGPSIISIIPERLQNFLHVPLFAGLAWCMLMSLSNGQWRKTLPLWCYGVVGVFAIVYAAVDEWHQSFIPGRFASLSDFFVDCVGIVGLLFAHWLWNREVPTERSTVIPLLKGNAR